MSNLVQTETKFNGNVNPSYDGESTHSYMPEIRKDMTRRDSLLLDISISRKDWSDLEIANAGIYRKLDIEPESRVPISTINGETEHSKKSFSLEWKWVVLAACFLAQALSIGLAFSITVIFVYILNEYGSSKAETSVIFSVLLGAFHMCGFLIGILISKVGPRVCGIIGSLLSAIGLSISFFANGIAFLSISLGAFTGLGLSLSFISSSTCVGLYFTSDKSKLMALSFLSFGSGIGSMVFPYVLSQLSREYGWKGCLLIGGAIVFNMVPCFAVCRPLNPNTSQRLSTISVVTNKSGFSSRHSSASNLQIEVKSTSMRVKEVLQNRVYSTYTLGFCFFMPAISAFIQFFVDFLQNTKGFNEDTVILLYFILNFSSTIARVIPGICKKFIPGFSVLMVPIMYICIGIVAFLLFPGATTLLQHGLLTSATGLMLGGAISAMSVTTMKLVGSANYAIALGLILFFIGIGNLSAGPIAGYLRDVTENYTMGIYLSAVSLFLAVCFFSSAYLMRSYGWCQPKKASRRRRSSVIPWKNKFEYIF